jgi:putative Ca2+/H+ antiporter (TMEM165/GDT1 family)
MHLDTSLALNVSRDSVSNTSADAPTVYVLSKDKTAAVFAASSVASLSQNSMAVAKGKAASPMLFTHWRLLASELIFGSYFVSATHEDNRTTENTKTNFPKTFLTTAQTPERDGWTTILLFNYSNLKT